MATGAIDYIEEMRKVLLKERNKNNLVGIKFCSIPQKGAKPMTPESLARAYCAIMKEKRV